MSAAVLLKLLHVVAGFGLVAGAIGRNVTFRQAARSPDVRTAQALLQASEFFERSMLIPASMAVLLFGLATAWLQGWPILGFLQGGDSNWVLVSLVLFLLPGLVVPGFLITRRKGRLAALEDALAKGKITPQLTAALNDRFVAGFRAAELAGLGVIIILMVTKPF